MTDPNPSPPRQIPTRVRRLRDVVDGAPDLISPLAALGALVAILGMTCLPLSAALATAAARGSPPGATRPAGAIDGPTTLTLLGVLVFFLIAILGIAGGIGTILRRQWGRRLLIGYAALMLLYLITAVYLRFRYGIGGLTGTAPTRSALLLNLTCSGGMLVAVAALMIVIVRYFTFPHIVRRFR